MVSWLWIRELTAVLTVPKFSYKSAMELTSTDMFPQWYVTSAKMTRKLHFIAQCNATMLLRRSLSSLSLDTLNGIHWTVLLRFAKASRRFLRPWGLSGLCIGPKLRPQRWCALCTRPEGKVSTCSHDCGKSSWGIMADVSIFSRLWWRFMLPDCFLHCESKSTRMSFCRNFTKYSPILSDNFVADFPQSVSVKELWNSFSIWWSYNDRNSMMYFFDLCCSVCLSLLCITVINTAICISGVCTGCCAPVRRCAGVLRWHPHRWQELATLPSVGANP